MSFIFGMERQKGNAMRNINERLDEKSDGKMNDKTADMAQKGIVEKVYQFDKKLQQMYSYENLMRKMVFGMMLFAGYSIYLIGESVGLIFGQIPILMMTASVYLDRYLVINIGDNTFEKGENIEVLMYVRWLPVNLAQFQNTRKVYLKKLIIKMMILGIILSCLGGVINKDFDMWYIVVPVWQHLIVWICLNQRLKIREKIHVVE